MTAVKEDKKKFKLMLKIDKNLIGTKERIPRENIGDLILKAFKSRSNFIGQVSAETEEQITFEQMRENSVKCALWLKKIGIKKGDVITICTRNQSITYVPFLASLYIGAIVNPWEEKYFRDIIRVMYFLVINKPDVVFVDEDNFVNLLLAATMLKSIDKIIKIVTIGEINSSINSLEAILKGDFDKTKIDNFSCEKNCMTDIAIRTFSSITLNYPGQVDIPYVAFITPSNKETPIMLPGDTGLWYGSLCWTHGPLLTVHSILSYVTAIKSTIFNEDNLYKTIEKYKVTWVFLESDMANQLFEIEQDFLSKYNISSLEVLLFDNWSIRRHIHEELVFHLPEVSVIRVYSKPETGVIAYQHDSDLAVESAGHVTKNIQVAFFGDDNVQLDSSKISPIYCKTPYIKHCSKHIVPEQCTQPWYYTADKGYYDKNGKIFVIIDAYKNCIRYKETIILSPGYIENLIYLHPAVSEVIVTAVRHPIDFEHPVAYVKLKSGAKVTEKELIALVEKNCHDNYKLRGGVHFITYELPRLPNGKINREHFRLLSTFNSLKFPTDYESVD